MQPEELAIDLSSAPLLEAVERFSGNFLDLDRGQRVSASQFHAGLRWLKSRLRSLGLDEGDRVVFAISNGPQFVAMLSAVLSGGGSPILSHALTPAPELRRIAMRFGARHIVSDRPSNEELAAVTLSVESITGADWLDALWSAVDVTDPGFIDSYPSIPATPLHPTSGTTGVPKIAIRPGAAAVAEARHYIQATGIDQSDSIVVTSPMSHAYAYGMGVMVPMLSGADIVSMREFQPKLLFEAFATGGVTVFPAVPAMLDVLLFGAGDRLKKSPRTVFAAGAPLTERVARTYREKSGVTVRPLYGTTETGGISIAIDSRDSLCTGCVGSAMDKVEIRLAATAEEGQSQLETLCVRSPSMMAGYLDSNGIDRSSLCDGWFNTGDLSRQDERNSIHLQGRITEVINVGGMKVVPREVEEVIASIDGVREVKVYAGNSRSGVQFVKAAVVAQPSVSDKTIREHCSRELIYYKRPSAVLMLDALPKTPSGKVLLNQLL